MFVRMGSSVRFLCRSVLNVWGSTPPSVPLYVIPTLLLSRFLKKHFHALLERTVCGEDKTKGDQHSPSSIRILVPLCGKTVDMMW